MTTSAAISKSTASAAASPPGMKVHIVYRDGAGAIQCDWPREQIAQAIADPDGTLWVDIEDPDSSCQNDAETLLRDVFGFHPLAVEDAIQESHIPKVNDWEDYIYLVFHATSIDPRTDVLRLHELDIFLGLNYVVTYHTEPLLFLDEDRKSIERDPRDRLRHGADHLLVRFLERAVDQSLEAIEHLDDRLDTVQNQVIADPRPRTLETIFRLKRSAVRLHKIFSPQRDVLNRLARDSYKPIRAEHRVYFRDVYDHVVRIHDISESVRDLIAGTLETYLSVVSNRTNEIMKTLTIVTVMFMPMSFLVGFFGMNFFGETLAFESALPKQWLFIGSLLLMCVSPSLMWVYMRRKKWF
jgi:magnesium transporter